VNGKMDSSCPQVGAKLVPSWGTENADFSYENGAQVAQNPENAVYGKEESRSLPVVNPVVAGGGQKPINGQHKG
jgi:hypothetical protein